MTPLILLLASCLFYTESTAQDHFSVRGTVIDGTSGKALYAASIVAQNTTRGTLSDSTGFFNISLPDGGYTLSISYTGYETSEIRINPEITSENLVISLMPKVSSLNEISVVLDFEIPDGWETYGQLFIDNFIGQSYFSKSCVIRNPSVLHFYYYSNRETLKVIAEDPLIVDNYALGYRLTFTIDSFINNFGTRTSMFAGYPVFQEMDGSLRQKNMWIENRNKTYYGSLLHFMRSLYEKNLQQDGFELRFILETTTSRTSLVIKDIYKQLNFSEDQDGSVHLLPRQKEVGIIYHRAIPEVNYLMLKPRANKRFQVSTFIFDPSSEIHVEKNGYYYPQEDITTNGYIGFKKMADMLPFDFQPSPRFSYNH